MKYKLTQEQAGRENNDIEADYHSALARVLPGYVLSVVLRNCTRRQLA